MVARCSWKQLLILTAGYELISKVKAKVKIEVKKDMNFNPFLLKEKF